MAKITGILVDVNKGTLTVERIADELPAIYKALNCSMFGVTRRSIGDGRYDIYHDDEGLLKEKPLISAIAENSADMMFVGNLFICKHDEEGNMRSINEWDIENIERNSAFAFDDDMLLRQIVRCSF